MKQNMSLWRRFKYFVAPFVFMVKGWRCKDGVWSKGNLKFKVGMIGILLEDFNKTYGVVDVKGKNVLDVGGLFGETMVFFMNEKKAKSVIVVEPVKSNLELIEFNRKINNIKKNTYILPIALGDNNDKLTITSHTHPGDGAFGLKQGEYVETFPSITMSNLINTSIDLVGDIELCKIDIEGGEKVLLKALKKDIVKIPNYAIEIHSEELIKQINDKFEKWGYSVECIEDKHKDIKTFVYRKR